MEPLRPGDPRQIGPYRIEGRLGEGGMGQVFLGFSPGGRKVAVKVIRPEHARSPQFRRRFAREVEAAQRVGGFHTAQVVGAEPEAESPWLATAFIDGVSLHDLVAERGPLGDAEVRALAAGLAEGLEAVHACGLVHRDLKPGNVIMTDDGPRIIDFGIAQLLDASALTSTGVVVGTFSFMSPEQIRDDAVGPPSDVFSLGCVLGFAATGSSPFAAGAIPAIAHRILSEPPRLEGVEGSLRMLIESCLAKDPAERPEPAALLGQSAPAPSEPPTERAPRPPRTRVETEREPSAARRIPRRAVLFGGFGAVAAAAAATAAVKLWPEDDKRQLSDEPTFSVLFSPAGGELLAVHQGILRLWNTSTGKMTAEAPNKDFTSGLAFSPDGKLLATGSEAAVALRDARTGVVLDRLKSRSPVMAIQFSGDGKTLAVGDEDCVVRLWDVASRKVTTTLAGRENRDGAAKARLWSMAYSPDGKLVAVGASAGVDGKDSPQSWLWDARSGRVLHPLLNENVMGLAFSPDSKRLASGSRGGVRTWNTATGKVAATFVATSTGEVAFDRAGKQLLSDGGYGVRVWDAATAREITTVTGDEPDSGVPALSPDGKTVATCKNGVTQGDDVAGCWLWRL
ncbi:WD40 repeat domain-containing serine/threonine protein kinase [Streptomyces boninensis]|uniref:WD40 repeat domain-containing serine/threonine protein kinase n=1 Tax=Streptomyces boninensis TaxID=2039455 RepID=UPI003B211554